MSHHFDWPIPGVPGTMNQDVSDVHCFAGPSDNDGPRTVIGMNASPMDGAPWDPGCLYELKLDLNGDLVEDITWRFTFPPPDPVTNEPKYFQVAQLNGADATSRTAPGMIITPPNAPVGEVLSVNDGIKIFAGKRRDSFFTDVRVPEAERSVLPPPKHESADPGLGNLKMLTDMPFLKQNVRLVMVELPATITGRDRIQCWGSTAIFDTGHGVWHQIQRAAGPDTAVVFDNGNAPYLTTINSTGPSADLAGRPNNPAIAAAKGVWGTLRDQVAAVVEAKGTYDQGVNGRPTPKAYGAWVADTLLPNVLRFTPGTTALWDPWNGVQNGKGLTEELASNFAKMITNTDFSTGLTQPGDITPYFPYLAEPVD